MIHLVLTTFGSEEDAARIVRTLVEEKLAACGTLLPGARSIYAWQGKIEDAAEVAVLFKTTRSSELEARLKVLHPYETPEIITLEPTAVSLDYAAWVRSSCSGGL